MLYPNPKLRQSVRQLSVELISLSQSTGLSSLTGSDVLGYITPHLDARRISSAGIHVPATQEAAELALSSMRLLAAYSRPHLQQFSRLPQQFLDLWPDLWAWLRYLLYTFADTTANLADRLRSEGHTITVHVLETVHAVLYGYAIDEASFEVMVKTPGLLSTVTDYYAQEDLFVGVLGRSDVFSAILAQLLLKTSDFTEATYVANGPDALVRLVLRRLRLHLARPDFSIESASHHLSILRSFWHDARSEMCAALLCAGLVRRVIKCVLALCEIIRPFDESILHDALVLCFQLIHDSCIHNGFSAGIEAIRHGLLHAMWAAAKVVAQMESEKASICCDTFQDVCASFLLYRPFIRAAARHVAELAHIPYAHGPFYETWLAFVAAVAKRLQIAERFQEWHCRSCHSCKRELSHASGRVMECSGCEGFRYCSRDCQKRHWLLEHRTQCTHHRRHLETMQAALEFERFTFLDKYFVVMLAEIEVEMNSVEVNRALAARPADLRDVVITVDFTRLPTTIAIGPHDKSTRADGKECLPGMMVRKIIATVGGARLSMTDFVKRPGWTNLRVP